MHCEILCYFCWYSKLSILMVVVVATFTLQHLDVANNFKYAPQIVFLKIKFI